MKKKPPAWRVSCGNVLWGLLFCLLQLNGATKEFSRCFIFKNCVLRNCQVESVGAFAGVEQVSCKVFLVTARRMHNSFPIVVRSGRCVFALAQSFLCIMQSGVQASFCHLAQIDLAVCCCTVAQYKLLAMAKKVQHNANVVETKKNPHNIHYVVEWACSTMQILSQMAHNFAPTTKNADKIRQNNSCFSHFSRKVLTQTK